MAKKYVATDLFDEIITTQEIKCSGCNVVKQEMNMDSMDACEVFFNQGWKKTKENVYCPDCSSKKLK